MTVRDGPEGAKSVGRATNAGEKDGKKGKKKLDDGPTMADLEEVVDELREEIKVKDQEYAEMRDNVDKMNKEVEFMSGAYN